MAEAAEVAGKEEETEAIVETPGAGCVMMGLYSSEAAELVMLPDIGAGLLSISFLDPTLRVGKSLPPVELGNNFQLVLVTTGYPGRGTEGVAPTTYALKVSEARAFGEAVAQTEEEDNWRAI